MKEITKHVELGTYVHKNRSESYPRDLHAYIQLDQTDHVNVTTNYESCKGILDHWGTCDELIAELEWIIDRIRELKKYIKERGDE